MLCYLVLHDHVADHGEKVSGVEGQGPHVLGQIVDGLFDADGALQQRFLHPQLRPQHVRVGYDFPRVQRQRSRVQRDTCKDTV